MEMEIFIFMQLFFPDNEEILCNFKIVYYLYDRLYISCNFCLNCIFGSYLQNCWGYAVRGTIICSLNRHGRYSSSAKKQMPQNVDLPPILPKKKKKPYPIPLKKIQQAARMDKKLAQMGIEKPLEPPKNGLIVPELVPVAHGVLDAWKVLIKGLAQLLYVIPVYGCR